MRHWPEVTLSLLQFANSAKQEDLKNKGAITADLGSDARASIAEKCTSTLEHLEEEKEVIDGTDYPKGE